MAERFLPTIEAGDGRVYTMVTFDTKAEAEAGLEEFVGIFREYNDAKIIRAYIQVFER